MIITFHFIIRKVISDILSESVNNKATDRHIYVPVCLWWKDMCDAYVGWVLGPLSLCACQPLILDVWIWIFVLLSLSSRLSLHCCPFLSLFLCMCLFFSPNCVNFALELCLLWVYRICPLPIVKTESVCLAKHKVAQHPHWCIFFYVFLIYPLFCPSESSH